MKNINKFAAELGRRGGVKSVEKRLGGMTPEERSAHMRELRMTPLARAAKMTPENKALFESGLQGMVDNLNKNASK